MSDLDLIRHRNQLMVKMYWILFFIGLTAFLFLDNTSMAQALVITALPPMLLITYYIPKLQFPKYTLYLISIIFITELTMVKMNDIPQFLLFSIIFGGLVIYKAMYSDSIRSQLTNELTRVTQLQSKLFENEARFKAMVKQSSDGIFAFNPLTKAVVETNERFCHMLGYEEHELLKLTISDFIVSDSNEIDENIYKVFQKERFFIGDKLYRCKDNSLILVEVSGSVIHLEDNSFILANVRDITERMESEALIQKQGRLLNGVAEALNCLLTNEDNHVAIYDAIEIIGRAVQVERVYIYENHLYLDQMVMSKRYEWGISEKIAHRFAPNLQNFPYQKIGEGRWYHELSAGRTIHGPLKTFPENEQAFLENHPRKSVIIVPIFILEKLWGFIGFDDYDNERYWTKNEESILLAAAAGIGGAIKLNQDGTLLQESEAKYRLLSARLEALISHMHYGILAEDHNSQLILSNQRFKEIFKLPKALNINGQKHIDFLKWHHELCGDYSLIKSRTKEIIRERSKVLGEEWLLKDGRIISRDAIPIFTNNQFDGYLWLFNDITKQKEIEQKLTEASILDGLTSIFNRRYFDENIQVEWKRCSRNIQPLSLIMLDIDCFKDFNDNYGHQSGDQCLKVVARTIKESLRRPSDFVCRYGGEEFAVVLPETHQEGGLQLAEKISEAIELLQIPHAKSDVSNFVTCSIGVATLIPSPINDVSELIQLADQALYQSKDSGRNCVSF
ncbi:diguanylate cyclase [Bacillus sp. DNRA2]|uniref:diguanylate cyclase domain-containing protein n=1 Tax=Bacillus sp. DNRA2 TaxID=2723053 RepID=UPI00145EE0A3|nr:diguanylate cyclase [Bacillus sp. DNRA2]NMD69268.1 diguanylate cyclase [Bacillus sp. DNRA2]